jgi:HEAT repeat protein
MLKEKIASLLKIHAEEIRMVALVSALFLFIQAGQGIGENAAFGLFLGRVTVDQLPIMYIGLGGFVSLASLAYATTLSRFRDANVVTYLLAISVFLFLGQWLVIAVLGLAIYSVLWLTTYGMSVILGTLLWTIAGAVCDARQAKRLFSLFASTGILGSVLGNLLTGMFASLTGTDSLIILYALLLGIGFFLTREITRSYFKFEAQSAKSNLVHDLRVGFDFVRGSQLFRLVAICSILYSVLFFSVDFPFSAILSNRFSGDAASLAGFKGVFTSITTAVTFLVSLFLANRLYARLGIIGSILIMPITYVVAFLVFFVSFTFTGAVFVRFSQLVILGGLMGTAWNALFNVVPPEQRGQVLAFNNGVPAQLGVLLSGVMILLSKKLLGTQDVLLLGAFVACVSVYITLKMRGAYGEALLSALRSGRVEVFSDQHEAFSGYQNDAAALQVIQRALNDSKASLRHMAVEMVARMGNRDFLPSLVDRLHDDDGTVRAAATRAVADLGGSAAFSDVILGLDDPDNQVREETLTALPNLGVVSSPELTRILKRLLVDQDPGVRAHAAVTLIALGDSKTAYAFLKNMMADHDVRVRSVTLKSFGHIAESLQKSIDIDSMWIIDAFKDKSALVRRQAAEVARYLPNDDVISPLATLFHDEDPAVRRLASESLKQLWPRSRAVLLSMMAEPDGRVLTAVLDSIPQEDADALQAMHGYIQSEAANLRFLRSLLDALPSNGPASLLLMDTLKYREGKSEGRLIKAVGLFGNQSALKLIRKSLNAGDTATRAAALEALETLGDRKIIKDVLPILDRGGVFTISDEDLSPNSAIALLLAADDPWLRALAARAIPELGLPDQIDVLQKLKTDHHVLVKQAAHDALARMDGTKMKTLKTLSTLDRILLLREVPMFGGLSPEDHLRGRRGRQHIVYYCQR